MEYKVVMTIDAENDFDRHISYIVNQKKNLQAAGSVIDNLAIVDNIFHFLEDYENKMK